MKSLILIIATAAAICFSPVGTRASGNQVLDCADGSVHAVFRLQPPDGGSCSYTFGNLVPGTMGQVLVEVQGVPFQKARFTLPDPPFGVVTDETWNFPVTGDRHTGIEVDLGSCSGQDVVLGTLTIFVASGVVGPCASWRIADGCEIEDCTGRVFAGVASDQTFSYPANDLCNCCWQCCYYDPPYGLDPADGTTGAPLDATLSWAGPAMIDLPGLECWVEVSTDPACGTGQTFQIPCSSLSFAPDFLAGGTTYYWRVGYTYLSGGGCSNVNGAESEIYSFTTEGPVAAESATWGHVKAMYRE